MIRDDNRDFLGNFSQVSDFLANYGEGFRTGFCTLTEGNGPDPNKVAYILVRCAVEITEEDIASQKFILGLNVVNFGDMITIDLISHNKAYHRDIMGDHVVRMGWPQFEDVAENPDVAYLMPFEWAGGFLQFDGKSFSFSGESGDFSGGLLGRDVCSIARFCASVCGLPVATRAGEEMKEGEELCQTLLDLMHEHKLEADFYERLAIKILPKGRRTTGQQVSGLITMKVVDRMTKEPDADPAQIIVEEMSILGNVFLVSRVR